VESKVRRIVALILLAGSFSVFVSAQTTEFTYQGSLKTGTMPANGLHDFEFHLFAVDIGGSALASLQRNGVDVANGAFSVKLDFGAQFPGANRYLEIKVRTAGGGAFTTLTPRQQISNAPYSVRSLNTANADNALQLAGVAANQYVLTGDLRLSDARAPLPGSGNYIQNGTVQQPGNFNIAGNGIVGGNLGIGTLSAAQKFQLISGTTDIRMGSPNGADGIEIRSSAAGHSPALYVNHTGTGGRNFRIASFGDNINPGTFIVRDDTIGADRILMDGWGRIINLFGDPSFISTAEAGGSFTFNRIFSPSALGISVEATNGLNAFDAAGLINIGVNTGREGTFNPSYNGYWFRADSRPAQKGFHFFKKASSSGTETELVTITDDGNMGIGTSAPSFPLHVNGNGIIRAVVNSDSNAGLGLSLANEVKWSVATANGGAFQIFNQVNPANAVWIEIATNRVGINTSTPDQQLTVNGNASKTGGGSWATFSDERLKDIHGKFTRGLAELLRLNPIRYEYKPDNALGLRDNGENIGFSAQEIERILPEAVTRSENGYLQINNDPILWTMLNAVKEQQIQIERQRQKIDALTNVVCSLKPETAICKEIE
jgi:hypothetical protein